MTDTTYNGWTNYATWRVNLELCNDTCASMQEDVDAGYRDRFSDISELADYLQDYVEEALQVGGQAPELTYEYAIAFLSDVNWYEIAEHWTDELIEKDTALFPACTNCGAVLEGDDNELCDQCRMHQPD